MDELSTDLLTSTRKALHALAESAMAGPQHRESGTIRLRVLPGSIETVAAPQVRLTATSITGPGGGASLLGATSLLAVGAATGVGAGIPVDLYGDHAELGADDRLSVDTDSATALLEWLSVGAAGLMTFAPDEQPVLWPEHFDLAITLDEVNYGVSPGDGFSAAPYAYVGPHTPVDDPFFDVPFGAARTWDQVPDAQSLVAFFSEGRDKARARPS